MAERLRGGMRVIAPDRPGYGRTGGEAVGFRKNAAAAIALLDRFEIVSAVIAAHSWAAGIALAAALDFPERIQGLVLAGPIAPAAAPSRIDRVFANRLVGPPAIRFGFWAAGLGLAVPVVRRLAEAALPAMEADRLARIASEWRGGEVWRSFYAEQRALVEETPALARSVPALRTPVTIVAGSRDRIAPLRRARVLARDLPQARLIEVDGGHLLPQQRPGLVAAAIEAAAR